MNIVYSSSDLYSELAGISMVSLFENNREEAEIRVFLIDGGISEENKARLRSVTGHYGRELVFVPEKNIEELSGTGIRINGHSAVRSISTYDRLLLGSLLPDSVERVIYLDCDTLVTDSLSALWRTDMGDRWALGADDCRGVLYRREIGIPDTSVYINNGVLLLDLKAWREHDVERLFTEFIFDHAGVVTYDDEGVLNGVLGGLGKTGLLPLRYNVQAVFYALSYREIERYRRAVWSYGPGELEAAVASPAVIHFTSFFLAGDRVWNETSTHPKRELFLHYKALSPWKDTPPWPDNRSARKKLETELFRAIPKPLLLTLFAPLHAFLYPHYRILLSRHAQRAAKLHSS